MPRDRGQPAARAQEHGRRRLRRRSSSGRAAQATGPLLRPQGRFAFPAEMACGHPRPRRPRRPLGQEERAGAGPAPARRAARRAGGRLRVPRRQGTSELAFDNQKRGGKITQMQARAQGPVASSQQSHLAKLRHTEPGVHETRDAPARCAHTLPHMRVERALAERILMYRLVCSLKIVESKPLDRLAPASLRQRLRPSAGLPLCLSKHWLRICIP